MDRIHEVRIVKKKNLLQDICGPGSAVRRSKELPDLVICGLIFGPTFQKQLRKKEKQEWAMEKPKLDNARKLRVLLMTKVDKARRLRGIYFIDP